MSNLEGQLRKVLEDMESGKISFQEAKKIALSDIKNEQEKLQKELDAVKDQNERN